MDSIKTFLTSKRALAIAIAFISGLVGKYGYEISPELQGTLTDAITTAVTSIASVYAIGRHVSQKKKIK